MFIEKAGLSRNTPEGKTVILTGGKEYSDIMKGRISGVESICSLL